MPARAGHKLSCGICLCLSNFFTFLYCAGMKLLAVIHLCHYLLPYVEVRSSSLAFKMLPGVQLSRVDCVIACRVVCAIIQRPEALLVKMYGRDTNLSVQKNLSPSRVCDCQSGYYVLTENENLRLFGDLRRGA